MTSSAPPKQPPVELSDALKLGISEPEWKMILTELGRAPTELECQLIAYLWSDQCTQRSIRVFLRTVFRESPNAVFLEGRNAGALEIGFDESLVLALDEASSDFAKDPEAAPQLLAASLVGELAAAGARPLVYHNLERIGDAENTISQETLQESLNGLASFTNTVGIPVLGHDFFFHERYDGRPVLNGGVVAVVPSEQLRRSKKARTGDVLLLLGRLPGKEQSGARRVSPYLSSQLSYLLTDSAFMEQIVDAQLVGRGGFIGAAFQLARRLQCGVNLTCDPLLSEGAEMSARDILFSRPDGQLLAIVRKDALRDFREACASAVVGSVEIGSVLAASDLEVIAQHQLLVGLPLRLLAGVVDDKSSQLSRFPPMLKKKPESPEAARAEKTSRRSERLDDMWLDLLADPNLCSRAQAAARFDTTVGTNTVFRGETWPAVTRIKRGKSIARAERAIASVIHSSTLYSSQDPYLAGVHTVAEAMRKLAAVGAAAVGCAQSLNFGNPQEHRQMSDFAETLRGMSDACRSWDLPIVSDRITFSTQTGSSFTLPVACVLLAGVVSDITRVITPFAVERGDALLLFGETKMELQSSEYRHYRRLPLGKGVPDIDFLKEKQICDFIVDLAREGLLRSAVALGKGGLAAALAHTCLGRAHAIGASLEVRRAGISEEAVFFGETSGRFLVSCSVQHRAAILERCRDGQIVLGGEGKIGGKELSITVEERYAIPLTTAAQIYTSGLDHILEHGLEAA